MSSFPKFEAQIDPDTRSEIQAKLTGIESDHDVRILFAIESGSRAWGFPSPDSDYDARFVYAHRQDWYLSLEPGRDVIELPINDLLDINGWDIRKALNLALKPNPVLLEWLSSPIRYRWSNPICNALKDLTQKIAHRTACRFHYLSLGEGQWNRHVGNNDEVNIKKYFYILRPALALRWLRMHPETIPPMNLQAMIAGLDLDEATTAKIAEMLEQKSRSRELGMGPRIAEVDALIETEFSLAQAERPDKDRSDHREAADQLFRDIVSGALTQDD